MSEVFIINGNSVSPFFNNHDLIKIEKVQNPEDINLLDFIVYQEEQRKIIKQCIGIPGNFIYLDKNLICIDFKKIKLNNEGQIFCWNSWIESCSGIIPQNSYFLIGTIPESIDSKQKGFINYNQILGKPVKC